MGTREVPRNAALYFIPGSVCREIWLHKITLKQAGRQSVA